NVFIAGVVSSETGTAANDVRVKGVNYLATNVGGHNIVSPSYGGQNFVIQSFMSYGQPSSIDFGIKIEVTGLTGNFNLRNNVTGNVDASQARVSKITYITDEAGDHAPTVSFTSVSCTTSGLHAQVKNPTGTPCSTGSTGGSKNSATVEVWGDYTCTNVSNGAGSMTITGSFDGYTYLVDSCESGGGGGGVVPIRL
ncbi:MAG: hypothetical protein H7333_00475, partial [Bdellovibrionales bacterium]|nr:hypothetical protein [Oligoflexia bacterium]